MGVLRRADERNQQRLRDLDAQGDPARWSGLRWLACWYQLRLWFLLAVILVFAVIQLAT